MSTRRTTANRSQENIDMTTVASFGDEWTRYDQSKLSHRDHWEVFQQYFRIFPWKQLPSDPEGFDMGCGSGRWARLVAPQVALLNCIDPAPGALAVAKRNLVDLQNVAFHLASTESVPLAPESQDFGYSLGVLHHVPNTGQALKDCVKLLRPGAPFLLYLYYDFENRQVWFRMLWRASEAMRIIISRLPLWLKPWITDMLASLVYFPLARVAWLGERLGVKVDRIPLSFYRNKSFYAMRTDSRDRFGTPLEQRFSRAVIRAMMERAGLQNIEISDKEPYWCAVGIKS
jgi:SAM-dependent methyltransferase